MRLREAVAISPCDAMEDSRGSSARRWMLPGRLRYTCREFTRSVIGNADVETPLELVVNHDSVTCQCPGRTSIYHPIE